MTVSVIPPGPAPSQGWTEGLLAALDVAAREGSLKRTLAVLAREAACACNGERCSLFLLVDDDFRPVMSQFADGRQEPGLWKKFRDMGAGFRPDSGVLEAIRTGRAVSSADLPDERFSRSRTEPFGIEAILAVPLRVAGRTLGAMVVDRAEQRAFTEEESRIAEAFGSQAALVIESARYLEQERRNRERAEAIAGFATALASHLEASDLFETLVSEARRTLRSDHAVLLRFDPDTLVVREVYASGGDEPVRRQLLSGVGVSLERLPLIAEEQGLRDGVAVEDAAVSGHVPRQVIENLGVKSYLALGLWAGKELVGLLVWAESSRRRRYRSTDEILLARALAGQASVALENAMLYQRTLELTLRDHLTGLSNRRAFEERMKAEVERSHRYSTPTSLVVLDLDRFKRVNDHFGHQTGDRLLESFADLLRAEMRAADTVYRIGGEEFALLLSDTELSGAVSLAERIVRRTPRIGILDGSEERITASAGVASFIRNDTADTLFGRADAALYEMKSSGGDGVAERHP